MIDRRLHRRLAGTTRDRAGGFTGDDRGVAEVLGAILMFALVVLVLVLIQLNAVPAANQQVEFEHNQRVQGDMGEFQEALTRSAATGTESTTTIETGVGYQPRLFLLNPPRASGTVETVASGEVRIANARAAGATGDYWTGSDRTFESGGLAYRPDYNEYPNPPTTVYENGVLYNRFENDRSVVHERGALISGDTVSLIALQGSFSTGSDQSVSVGTTPISGPARTITVSDTGEPIKLTVPTELSVETWRDILADEMGADGHVTAVQSAGDDAVLIELEQGVTYNLRMAAVGVGSGFDAETSAQYIVDESGNGSVVPEGGSQRLVAEVRDGFNNPVSNVSVANTTNLADANVRFAAGPVTDADGQIELVYQAPPDVNDLANATVTVSFGTNSSDRERVRFHLGVIDSDGSGAGSQQGGGSGGNPLNPAATLQLTDSRSVPPIGGGGVNCENRQNNCHASMTIDNRASSTGWSVEQMRVSVYNAQGENPPTTTVVSDSQSGAGRTLTLGNDFSPVNLDPLAESGQSGDSQTYYFEFSGFQGQDGVVKGDFFVVEIIYEDDAGDQSSVTYVVPAGPP